MAETGTPARPNPEPIYRRNFYLFLADNVLFTLAMNILGPNTLIPDFIRRLTHSEILIGLSSSLFDIGWTLPQLFVARLIVRVERMKMWFVGPNIPVRFIMLGFALLTAALGKDRPGAILVAFIVCYGLAAVGDGLVGIPWVVLAGSSLDGRWRARMFGMTTAIAGVLMLGIAPLIGKALSSAGPRFPQNYALVFGSAGVLFALSIIPVVFVHELAGGKAEEQVSPLGEFLPKLGEILRMDRPFRAILATRMFTSLFGMANPFYIGFATTRLGLSSTVAVPTLLAMQTIGSVSGALAYFWIGARHNRQFIRLGLAGAALLPIGALLAAVVGPLPLYIGFLISGLTVGNLFLSFLNWIIGYSTPEQLPLYSGLFNMFGALVSLAVPLIGGTIAQTLGYEVLFGVALTMVLAAQFVVTRYVS